VDFFAADHQRIGFARLGFDFFQRLLERLGGLGVREVGQRLVVELR
jgi:hypothetical protein